MTPEEVKEYIDKFLKHPIFVEQEAKIVVALHEGKITKASAQEIYRKVVEHNITKMRELAAMTIEEIMRLADESN